MSQRVVSELLDVGFYERVGKGDDVDVVDEIMPLQPSCDLVILCVFVCCTIPLDRERSILQERLL